MSRLCPLVAGGWWVGPVRTKCSFWIPGTRTLMESDQTLHRIFMFILFMAHANYAKAMAFVLRKFQVRSKLATGEWAVRRMLCDVLSPHNTGQRTMVQWCLQTFCVGIMMVEMPPPFQLSGRHYKLTRKLHFNYDQECTGCRPIFLIMSLKSRL